MYGTRFALALVSLAVGCDGITVEPTREESESVAVDSHARVEIRMKIRPTFLDPVADYRVVLARDGQAPIPVLESTEQAQHVRGRVTATRLAPDGPIAIALNENLCVLGARATQFTCRRLTENAFFRRESPDFLPVFLRSLEWMSRNQACTSRHRAHAAALAARLDEGSPQRSLATLEAAINGAELQNDAESLLQLRAMRYRFAPREQERAEIQQAVKTRPLAEVMAVARACNPTFEPAIREREQRAPEALQAEFSLIRTRCESIR